MRGTIDSYTQMHVFLNEQDVSELEENQEVEGEVCRSGETLPLILQVREKGWRAGGVPTNKYWEEKEAYEIDMPPQDLEQIKQREVIDSQFPTINLRMLYISLEGVL